jgi:pSer/pThr/pTyr-binding forkhead associated (FHA) protein
MPAILTIRFADRAARPFPLDEGGVYRIGRQAGCEISLDDARVSRHHARLESRDGRWLVVDLGSKNGVSVDGRRVTGPVELPTACWLSLGGLLARFERLSEAERSARAERERERWQSTLELHRHLTPAADLPRLLTRLLESVLELSGAERGFVLLARPGGDLEVAATVGVTAGELGGEEFAGSVGAVERALAEGRPVVTADAQDDAALASRPSIAGEGIRALVCLPLEAMGRRTGAVYADSRTPGSAFTELDVEILEALTSHAALAIAVARLSREMESLAGDLPTRRGDAGADARESPWERALPVYDPAAAAEDPAEATWIRLGTALGR